MTGGSVVRLSNWRPATFTPARTRADVSARFRIHDLRHTAASLKWAGHYDSAFTQKTYVHASSDDLQQGRTALARIHKIA